MKKVDVAIQSYKKPESLIYTLFSLKKYCGDYIDTIYINDDCSGDNILKYYESKQLIERMKPIKLKIRENIKPSGYTHTLLTKEMWSRKKLAEKMRLIGHFFIKRAKIYSTSDDIRYQWALNNTDKKYIFLIHDDIKFFDNVLEKYIECMEKNKNLAIVGDLGGSKRCPFGPCGKKCSPEKILRAEYPCKEWPITGRHSIFHTILGRYKRNCRINEWCCLINVEIAKQLKNNYGIYFGNYEGGGDVGTYWFNKIIDLKYDFYDPYPNKEEKDKHYLHWWQGYEGHSVWVSDQKYKKEYVEKCLEEEFNYKIRSTHEEE